MTPLEILAGCLGEGATHDALLLSSGCTADDLAALVRDGFARQRTAPMANPPGLVITRYWITDSGTAQVRAPRKSPSGARR